MIHRILPNSLFDLTYSYSCGGEEKKNKWGTICDLSKIINGKYYLKSEFRIKLNLLYIRRIIELRGALYLNKFYYEFFNNYFRVQQQRSWLGLFQTVHLQFYFIIEKKIMKENTINWLEIWYMKTESLFIVLSAYKTIIYVTPFKWIRSDCVWQLRSDNG